MGIEKIFSWIIAIFICGLASGSYDGHKSYKERPLRPRSSQTLHKPSNHKANEPQAVKYEQLDQFTPISLFCDEQNLTLFVKADLHNNGIRVSSEELLLGQDLSAGPACRAFPINDIEYVIEASLHECGTLLAVEEDSLIYHNVLSVLPRPTSSGIIRTSSAIIPIACHYQRRHFVSSDAIHPSWDPFASTTAAMELLDFSLTLMAGDGRTKSSSKKFVLGELLRFEASVTLSSHIPLRIFLDTCYATMDPNMNSEPRYAFIQNHGCLSDATDKGSHARFMPRSSDEQLQVEMDAFMFSQGFPESEMYISCQLKVTAASQMPNAMNKACSYSDGRWRSVDGDDSVCRCCDSTCLGSNSGVLYSETVELGPLTVADKTDHK
ncbi:hypothetical protein GJAV_G00125880 [Gymnothorax javanicus]|nr:hypothetical protein GJAV_G00125880 [Gymnothorax javanicus]